MNIPSYPALRFLAQAFVLGAFITFSSVGHAQTQSATITFSTLSNGDQNQPKASFGDHLPSTYQPLNQTYTPTPGSAQDGFNLGVTMTYNEVLFAQGARFDHTGDTPKGLIYNLAGNTFSISFSNPVSIPSFWFGVDASSDAGQTATFTVTSLGADGNPMTTVETVTSTQNNFVPQYTDSTAGISNITSISFESGNNLTIDDLMVSVPAVPELSTGTMSAVGVILFGLTMRLRRPRRA